MTFKEAVTDFVNIHNRFSDYWFMQECWECYKDSLARDNRITERQRYNWDNPCTPETFKRWNNKWYGLANRQSFFIDRLVR